MYCWGKNDNAQLGLGHSDRVQTPTILNATSGRFLKIFCGFYHTIALTSDKKSLCFW